MSRWYRRSGGNKGCAGRPGCGCMSLLFIFLLVVSLLSSIEFPELNFGSLKTVNYVIDMDSLSTERFISASYSWKFVDNGLGKRRIHLKFKLLSREVKKAMQLIDEIGNMTLEELGLNPRLNYDDPEIQAKFIWSKIYRIVYSKSYQQMETIFKGFSNIFKKEKMNNTDRVSFVVTFVQNIKYERPGGTLDLLAPLGTLAKKFGDCDSKSILLYVILERMGIDCAMMWSHYYKHAMLGIWISGNGSYKILNGKKYYFLETTSPGWNIGELPPDFRNKRYWYIDEIDKTPGTQNNKYKSNRRKNRSNKRAKPSPAN
ncbi:hypothetical protein BMS3Abin03_02926 [bacterium BMS3Abin03]|nr:hypothetical protein BMS3Abin03_02926 [bacterium BMS3Abin03]